MITAFISVVLATILFSTTIHIDNFLIDKISLNGDYKGLLVVSTLIAGIILLPISIILSNFNLIMNFRSLVFVFLSAISYILMLVFYYKALYKSDADIVIVIFQMLPVISLVFGAIFLKEYLTIKQIIGCFIIVISTMAISIDFKSQKNSKEKLIVLGLAFLSVILEATYNLFFRFVTLNNEYYTVIVWYQISLLIIGLFLLSLKTYRYNFIHLIKENGKKIFCLNLLNEVINLIGIFLSNYAITLIPMTLVLSIQSTQPFVVFILGAIGVMLIPKYVQEDLRKNVVIKKIICIAISIIGILLLYI